MKERIYEIRLTKTDSIPIEHAQNKFMEGVYALAKGSNLIGHGIEIEWTNTGR